MKTRKEVVRMSKDEFAEFGKIKARSLWVCPDCRGTRVVECNRPDVENLLCGRCAEAFVDNTTYLVHLDTYNAIIRGARHD